ncbi:MAG: N-acetyl sugar amidotransferase [Anaerolineales bacterium]|nr:N-acetyl sugar amidotransferase [Anaerolineales bacterium]
MKRCSRCLYDETVPAIVFDEEGVCNYCSIHDQLNEEYPTGEEGRKHLEQISEKIKREGRGKQYDVIVGVSGGCDSTYMLYLAKELGLRPLAVHFDNTWDSTVAVENIQTALKSLDVDLHTYVVDNREYDDIYRSFLKAGVLDIDSPTDIGLAAVLNMAAEKYRIRYIFEGHSFRTEGIAPLGWIYMDGRYVKSVQKKFGTIPLRTYPNMLMFDFIKWTTVLQIQKIRPLYYIDYVKKDAMKLLSSELGWEWYGGHHLENRFTAFWHTYYAPKRYGIDSRLLGYAALVRSGQITREEGLELISKPQPYDADLIEMLKKRLGFSDKEFDELMTQDKKTYRDYKTYKKNFERMRPFWWLMYKLNRVPKSFYLKFCFPDPLPSPSK